MTVKRRDFQKIAALIHEFLLKLDEDAECAEVRDSLNYALLQLQRYFRMLRNRNVQQSSLVHADRSATNGSNGLSLLGQSLRGMSPMTPFKDAPDKFVWRWADLQSTNNSSRTAGATLPARLDKEATNVPPVLRAARQGDKTLLVQLFERGETLQRLLQLDANCFNEVDCLGRTALMYAVQSSSLDTLQLLLEQYADVNALAEDGSTAVHRACCNGNHEALRILVQYEADLTVQDNQGRAPIHWAAIAPTPDCLEVLLNKGVDADTRDRDGLSPMMWACRWDRIDNFALLSKHSEMERRNRRNRQYQGVVDENGFERDDSGKTFFHWSVRRVEPLECLSTLLTEPSADFEDNSGKTVMHVAAEQGSLPAVKVILEIAGKQCLEQKDKNNRSPLVLATMGGHGEVVNFLLSEGADYTCTDTFGSTAWDYARVRQMHYCLLIIASYIRQRTKSQTNGNSGSFIGQNGGGLSNQMFDVDDFGLTQLQINGDMAIPRPPPGPPVTPRTPRVIRSNGHMTARPNYVTQDDHQNVPQTPRGQSNKRLPTTPMDDGDFSNGYLADYERELPRAGSASKRLRGPDNEPTARVDSMKPANSGNRRQNSGNATRRTRRTSDDSEHDDYGVPEERAKSIDVMDVSDFEENDYDDQLEVPPSPRPPVQPRIEQRQRQNNSRAGVSASEHESRQKGYNDGNTAYSERPPSRSRKQPPATPLPRQRSADKSERAPDYYNDGGAWAEYETRPNSGAEIGATRDRLSHSAKSPPPPQQPNAPTPPSHLVPLASGAPLKKKKKKKLQASLFASDTPSSSQLPLNVDQNRQKIPSAAIRSRNKSEPSPDRETRGSSLYLQQDVTRQPGRPSSRSSSTDQWRRDQQTPTSNNDDFSDDETYSKNDDPYQSPSRPPSFLKGPKHNGPLYANGSVSPGQQMNADNRKLPAQPQLHNGLGNVTSAMPTQNSNRPPISPRRSLTTGRPAVNDAPWIRKPPLPNGDFSQRRH